MVKFCFYIEELVLPYGILTKIINGMEKPKENKGSKCEKLFRRI